MPQGLEPQPDPSAHPDCWPTFKIAAFFSQTGWASEQPWAYTLSGLRVSAETLVLGQQAPLYKPHTVRTGSMSSQLPQDLPGKLL